MAQHSVHVLTIGFDLGDLLLREAIAQRIELIASEQSAGPTFWRRQLHYGFTALSLLAPIAALPWDYSDSELRSELCSGGALTRALSVSRGVPFGFAKPTVEPVGDICFSAVRQ